MVRMDYVIFTNMETPYYNANDNMACLCLVVIFYLKPIGSSSLEALVGSVFADNLC